MVPDIGMVMGRRKERGNKEKQNEERGKVIAPVHDYPFMDESRIVRTFEFVKNCLCLKPI